MANQRKSTRQQRRFLRIESLEGRRMLAGDLLGTPGVAEPPSAVGAPAATISAKSAVAIDTVFASHVNDILANKVAPINANLAANIAANLAKNANNIGAGQQAQPQQATPNVADIKNTLLGDSRGFKALYKLNQAEKALEAAKEKLAQADEALNDDPDVKALQKQMDETQEQLDENQRQIKDTQDAIDDFERRAADPHVENPVDYQVRKLKDGSYQELEITKNRDGSIQSIKVHPAQDPAGELKKLQEHRAELEKKIQQQEQQMNELRQRKLAPCVEEVKRAERKYQRALRQAENKAAAIKRLQAAEEARERARQARQNRQNGEKQTPPDAVENDMRLDIRNPLGNQDEVGALLKALAQARKAKSPAERMFLNQLCNETFTSLTRSLGDTVSLLTGLANPKSPLYLAKLGLKAYDFIKTYTADPSDSIHDTRYNYTGTADKKVSETRITTIIKDGKFLVVVEMKVDASKTNTRQFKTGVVKSGVYRFVYEGAVRQ